MNRKHKEDHVGNIDNWEGFGQELQNENAVENEDDPEFENGQIEETIESMTRFIALFILKTKEQNQLSQQVSNMIVHNVENLVEHSLNSFKSSVVSCLTNNGIDIQTIDGLTDILEEQSLFARARSPLATEYLQVKYFVEL